MSIFCIFENCSKPAAALYFKDKVVWGLCPDHGYAGGSIRQHFERNQEVKGVSYKKIQKYDPTTCKRVVTAKQETTTVPQKSWHFPEALFSWTTHEDKEVPITQLDVEELIDAIRSLSLHLGDGTPFLPRKLLKVLEIFSFPQVYAYPVESSRKPKRTLVEKLEELCAEYLNRK